MNKRKIITASISGLAGGAAMAIELSGNARSLAVAILGSVAGFAITGAAEYFRQRRDCMRGADL